MAYKKIFILSVTCTTIFSLAASANTSTLQARTQETWVAIDPELMVTNAETFCEQGDVYQAANILLKIDKMPVFRNHSAAVILLKAAMAAHTVYPERYKAYLRKAKQCLEAAIESQKSVLKG